MSGSIKGRLKEKNSAMASRLKLEGKVAPKKWHGVGASVSVHADKMGTQWKGRYSSTFERGMLGGMLAEKLGFPIRNKETI